MTTRSASRRRVDRAGRKAQLHLRACADFAPHRQGASNRGGALRHAAQSVVSFDTLGREHRRIDALAVVPHPQSEFIVVVADLDLDPPGLRVPKRIPQRFRRNLVDLVTNDRVQVPRLSLDRDTECRRRLALASVASSSPKVLIATARSLRSTADARRPCTASRPSVIAFAACSIAPSSCLFRFGRARRAAGTTPSGTAAAARGSSEAACRAAPGRSACARRRAPRASCRTRAAPDASGAGTPPHRSTSNSPAAEARNQVVLYQGGVITIGSDTPSSFQTPSLFDPCTRNT